jgi:hypothetical protein
MRMGSAPSSPWLRNAAWDLAALAFPWVPFYLFCVVGLGLTGEWSAGGSGGAGREPGLGLAMSIALALSYVHRHYTFLLVYGDRETFAARARSYLVLPALAFVVLALIVRVPDAVRVEVPGAGSVSPWLVVGTLAGMWNVWHTVMQRHGIARIYAGKAGGGLQDPAHGRRDLHMLWSVIALVAVVVVAFRPATFEGLLNARRLLATLQPAHDSGALWVGVAAVSLLALTRVSIWLRHELAAPLPWRARVPRWSFLASTLALLGIFVVHGPIIGYLCFGVAHAIEYLFFLHHFGRRKFARPEDRGLVARMLRHPLRSGPLLVGSLLAVYWVFRDQQNTDAWLVYYTATSMLHFLYDGWIWKVRTPAVARPLGLEPASVR